MPYPARIAAGDPLPDATLRVMGPEGPKPVSVREALGKGRVVLFGVPGAFTPPCSNLHLPGFVRHAADFRAKGVDRVACVSVNDAFVMDAWGKSQGVGDAVLLLADGSAEFTRKAGLVLDASAGGLGERSQRYAMVLRDGVVETLQVEEKASTCSVSGAPSILAAL
jgi:peroxiredoxin